MFMIKGVLLKELSYWPIVRPCVQGALVVCGHAVDPVVAFLGFPVPISVKYVLKEPDVTRVRRQMQNRLPRGRDAENGFLGDLQIS